MISADWQITPWFE